MNNLAIISLALGFMGCFFVIFSFMCQLYQIYRSKNAKGTSWGLIISQIITCIAFGTSAGINVYLGGMINMPFLAANSILFILFLVMSYMKYNYDSKDEN